MKSSPSTTTGVVRGPDDLDEQALAGYLVRLLAYVRGRAKQMFGPLRGDDVALGEQCQDIAQEALASLFCAPQRWDPSNNPDPFKHLVSVANSKIIALKTKVVRRGKLGEEFAAGDYPAEAVDLAADVVDSGWRPESPEDVAVFRQLHDELLPLIIDDEQLIALYDLAVKMGRIIPRVVAAELGISDRQLESLKKKLRRCIVEAQKKLGWA